MASGHADYDQKVVADIIAQSLTALAASITLIAQTVGVYLQPEWAAKEEDDKDKYGTQDDAVAGTYYNVITYTVPTGKTLFISHFGCRAAAAAANVACLLLAPDALTVKAVGGGAQGFFGALNKPIRVVAGYAVRLSVAHFGAANQLISGHIGGWEE